MKPSKKIALSVLVVGLGLLTWGALTANQGPSHLKAGDVFPLTRLQNIHDSEVVIPNANVKFVHLQFRRFAGCPICNLHLHTFIQRYPEIQSAGIQEVVLFHSSKAALLPYQGSFPFDVVGDPEKKLYVQFGVQSSIFSILNPSVWPTIFKANSETDKPNGDPEGGPLGLPADLLISPEGKVVASHYGRHAYDQWSVDELLALAKQ